MESSIFNNYFFRDDNIVIFNSLTGAMVSLDEENYKNIQNNRISLVNKSTIEFLTKKGFLVKKKKEQLNTFYRKQQELIDRTLEITLYITMDCNFRCLYCYENHSKEKMGKEEIDYIINFINLKTQESKIDKLKINLFGGEPLLNLPIIYYFLDRVKEKFALEKYINITTNGYLLSDEIINNLCERGVQTFQITLDGLPHIDDSSKTTVFIKLLNLMNKKNLRYTSPLNIDGFSCNRTYKNSYGFLPDLSITKCTVYYEKYNLANMEIYSKKDFREKCLQCSIFPLCLGNSCFNQIDGNNCFVKPRVESFLKGVLGARNEH